MLHITIPGNELFNEETNEIITTKETILSLEHSLVSIAKWESKWKKPFLSKVDKTEEETLDYIRCMTLTQNVDPNVYIFIPGKQKQIINDYINDPMTATTFSNMKNGSRSNELITAEIIYYWMVTYQIPFECQKWHINRLLTLIKVCNVKNSKSENMSKSDIYRQNKALNAARRQKSNSKG